MYGRPFLTAYATPDGTQAMHGDAHITPRGWTASELAKTPNLFVSYHDLQLDAAKRLAALEHLAQTGLLLVSGVPNQKTSDEQCELRSLAGIFGEIRHTFYGQTWDVVAKKRSTNIAYTSLSLGLHMDLQCVARARVRPVSDARVGTLRTRRASSCCTVCGTVSSEGRRFSSTRSLRQRRCARGTRPRSTSSRASRSRSTTRTTGTICTRRTRRSSWTR